MLGFSPLSSVPLSSLPQDVIHVATGFTSGAFGTPFAVFDQFGEASGTNGTLFGSPTNRLLQPASGFAPVALGEPTGYKLQRAVGFQTGAFGAPRLFPFHVGPGVHTALFGSPAAHQFWRVSTLGPVALLGTPTTPTSRSASASGFAPGRFGTPVSFRTLPPDTPQIERAFGFNTVCFGAPRALWGQEAQASGAAPGTLFGTPRASGTYQASSLLSTALLGLPLVQIKQRGSGFSPTRLGAPRSIATQRVAGLSPRVCWGSPAALRSNWHDARGFGGTRFGQPGAYQRNNYHTTGLLGSHLGTPTCRLVYRGTALPPVVRFGTPLLKRIAQC